VSEPWGHHPPEEAQHGDLAEPGEDLDQPDDEPVDDVPHLDDHDPDDTESQAPDDEPPVVGDGPVATAVARLDSLADLPPAEHVEVYEDVHRVLQDALADAAHDGRGHGSGTDGSGEDRTGSP
jgi:hypothetical protein